MKKTGRGGGVLADAYFIMNREQIIESERKKAGKKALESLGKQPSIPSIGGGGRTSAGSMTAFESMSADQLAEAIANMEDRAALAFLKNAPDALKAKYPGIPWS